jgi:hypothetical protein
MTEDNFEEFLKKAAQSYNAPPTRTPREDMWSAIQAQRAAGPRMVYGGGSGTRESSGRRFGSKIWLAAAAAAVLFLATGVGIGRWTASSATPRSVAGINQRNPAPTPTSPEEPSTSPLPDGPIGRSSPTRIARGGAETTVPRGVARSGNPESSTTRDSGGQVATPGRASPNSTPASAYQLAAVRHLSEAEALLTSFRTRSTTDQQMDAQLGSWARSLLSNTRLLLDSPVANDPQRRPLLEDLELVLVQIVQLSPGSTVQDRDLIEKTLQQDHVMTRLRTAIPAGSQRGS